MTTPLAPARFFRAPLSSQRLPEHLAFVQSAFWQRGAPGRALRGGDDSGSSSSEDAGAGAFRCGGSSRSEDVGAAGAGAVVDAGTACLYNAANSSAVPLKRSGGCDIFSLTTAIGRVQLYYDGRKQCYRMLSCWKSSIIKQIAIVNSGCGGARLEG